MSCVWKGAWVGVGGGSGRAGVVGFFFFNDTATTEIYTLSLHDALPICFRGRFRVWRFGGDGCADTGLEDRKSTRLNSSHITISYAVFCLKKKKPHKQNKTKQKKNHKTKKQNKPTNTH